MITPADGSQLAPSEPGPTAAEAATATAAPVAEASAEASTAFLDSLPAAPADGAQDYDWAAPHSLTTAARQRLAEFAGRVAEAAARYLKGLMRRDIALTVGGVAEIYGAAAWDPTARPRYGVPMTDAAGQVCGMVTLPPAIAIGWVERLLGGSPAAAPEARPLSELESALLIDVVAALVRGVSEASMAAGGPVLKVAESASAETSPLAGQENTEFCRISLACDGAVDGLDLVLAGGLALAIADPEAAKAPACPPDEIRRHLLAHLQDMTVDVTARLGAATITMRDAAALEPGDVILLNRTVDEPIEMQVLGNVAFCGHPVVCDGWYAVQIPENRQWPRHQLMDKEIQE